MSKTMYMTRGISIQPVKVVRETESTVWVEIETFVVHEMNEQMEVTAGEYRPEVVKRARRGNIEAFHESWEIARDYLLEYAYSRLASARRELQLAQSIYGNVKGLKRPKEPTP